jgi:hypothetical protein
MDLAPVEEIRAKQPPACIDATACLDLTIAPMKRTRLHLCLLVCSALAPALSTGCSADTSAAESIAKEVLDPTQSHYGKTDDEWGALWFKWIDELPQKTDACVIPFLDATGKQCGYGQSGDVFFLVGTAGGKAVRDKCVVPAGKAIFFPILNFTDDNGGIPASKQVSDADLKGTVQSELDAVPVDKLSASFDGAAIEDLGRFRTKVTQFSYTLGPEPNTYTCAGQSGVTGKISPSYAAGFYVMLAPPDKGSHTLHFAGVSPSSSPELKVDVTYDLTVQ